MRVAAAQHAHTHAHTHTHTLSAAHELVCTAIGARRGCVAYFNVSGRQLSAIATPNARTHNAWHKTSWAKWARINVKQSKSVLFCNVNISATQNEHIQIYQLFSNRISNISLFSELQFLALLIDKSFFV